MFKTIEECRLQLVAHSVLAGREGYSPEETRREQNADFLTCSAARASHGKEDKTGDDPGKDLKLIHYLSEHEHLTPFEYTHATFLVECPLFIRSQIHRHRTFSYNEISRRYTDEQIEFWRPTTLRGQHKSSKQASDGVIEDADAAMTFEQDAIDALENYRYLLSKGVAREMARAVLPQSLLTRFYMGGNLRNWAHFIRLRKDEHAQYEVRVIAERIENELRALWPNSVEALLG